MTITKEHRVVKLSEIIPYANNPRKNDQAVPVVEASIERFTYTTEIEVDESMVILAGHTRWKALKKMGVEECEVMIIRGMTNEEKIAYRLAHNKTGEVAEWDEELLMEEIEAVGDIPMESLGFAMAEAVPTEIVEDDFEPEIPEEPKSKRGEVYQLGVHFLMCGDSTDPGDVKILMDGNLADIVFTDPPWNVSYGQDNPKWKQRTIINDSMSTEDFKEFMGAVFERMKESLRGGGIVYVVMSPQEWGNLMLELRDKGMHWSSTIIWSKDTLVLSRKDYHTQYEPIWYGWEGSQARVHDVKDRTQSDVWQIARPKKSDEHPTMKPIELVARALTNSSEPGDTVLDLFGGSGTTLMAAEQTKRKCRMMELDPKYVDVIIDRWEKFTGKKAKKVVSA